VVFSIQREDKEHSNLPLFREYFVIPVSLSNDGKSEYKGKDSLNYWNEMKMMPRPVVDGRQIGKSCRQCAEPVFARYDGPASVT